MGFAQLGQASWLIQLIKYTLVARTIPDRINSPLSANNYGQSHWKRNMNEAIPSNELQGTQKQIKSMPSNYYANYH